MLLRTPNYENFTTELLLSKGDWVQCDDLGNQAKVMATCYENNEYFIWLGGYVLTSKGEGVMKLCKTFYKNDGSASLEQWGDWGVDRMYLTPYWVPGRELKYEDRPVVMDMTQHEIRHAFALIMNKGVNVEWLTDGEIGTLMDTCVPEQLECVADMKEMLNRIMYTLGVIFDKK